MGESAADTVLGRSAADPVMGGSAADTVMGGSAAGGPQVVQHSCMGTAVLHNLWLCSCCQITAPIIPTCPSMMGVVVLQQLQGHIDR